MKVEGEITFKAQFLPSVLTPESHPEAALLLRRTCILCIVLSFFTTSDYYISRQNETMLDKEGRLKQ